MKAVLFLAIALVIIGAVGFGYSLNTNTTCTAVINQCNEFIKSNFYEYDNLEPLIFNYTADFEK